MSSPKKRTRPAVAGKSPVMTLNSVVLPAPLAPITARRSPAATENETSSIARSAPNVRRDALELEGVTRSKRRCGRRKLGRPRPCAMPGGIESATAPPLLTGSSARRASRGPSCRTPPWTGSAAGRLGHGLDHLVVEGAVGALRHFGDEGRADRLTVLVERDLAGRRLELQVFSASRYFSWLPERSPLTASSPSSAAFMLM